MTTPYLEHCEPMTPHLNLMPSPRLEQTVTSDPRKTYKSPHAQLIRFFERSRNRWKAKCLDAKASRKRLQNRVRFLQRSTDRWKRRMRELEAELKTLKVQLRARAQELEAMKPSRPEPTSTVGTGMAVFRQALPYHTYAVGHVILFVSLVLSTATSLRGANQVIALMMSMFALPVATPSWSTGRLWLWRLGYYQLTRPKAQADAWGWIADHTVQLGPEKCLVILGLRLSALPASGRLLTHEDVEPLALLPVTTSTGEVVYQQLEETIAKTGVPRQIVADQGSDLRGGIERFCQHHPETCYVYDIKHKTAAVLKHD
jgi:hypothetical protein